MLSIMRMMRVGKDDGRKLRQVSIVWIGEKCVVSNSKNTNLEISTEQLTCQIEGI